MTPHWVQNGSSKPQNDACESPNFIFQLRVGNAVELRLERGSNEEKQGLLT